MVTRLVCCCQLLAACAPRTASDTAGPRPAAGSSAQVAFPGGWRFDPGRKAAFSSQFMIASNERRASDAGSEIIRSGGNAVDAAVAVGFALAVTYPVAGNLGGGGFMVIHMADGRTAALDYREVAPQRAYRDMYLDSAGNPTSESVVGYRASGVPGSVAGMAEALARYGSLPLSVVMQPAIRLARDGFVVDSALHNSLRSSQRYLSPFDGRDVFFPGGEALEPGTLFRQPALARTLELIASQGPAAFYGGEVGDSLVAAMSRNGGIISREDLASYRPLWREPIRGSYRGHTYYAMPPASSGGVTVAQTLNILETWDTLPDWGSAAGSHLLASAWQRAFIDRNSKLADPRFVQVPVGELTSRAWARRLAATIDPHRRTPTPPGGRQIGEGSHTTHYSVVDDRGNAVATTTTINNGYGSGVYLGNVGFFMNDEMDDFATAPGRPNMFGLVQFEQNRIEPGKRMLSAMSPTIVLDRDGKVLLVVGAAGGPRIITATSQVILNVIEHGMSLADAMHAPRIHHQALPDTLIAESGGLSRQTEDSLRSMGHAIRYINGIANVNAVMRVRGGWEGVSEPRSGGTGGTSGS